MQTAAVIGLGDMGSGLARNLLKAGFQVNGHDLSDERLENFAKSGGKACTSAEDAAKNAQCVFVMVMNGEQAKKCLLWS